MSKAPMRIPAGFTQDAPYQPLNRLGIPNPFFYAVYEDDFLHYNAADYTVTVNANGTAAATPGAYGRLLFTTNSSTPLVTDIVSVQTTAADFVNTATKKLAFLARGQLADVTNPAILWGLIQTTTTPFTVVDGIYFSKVSGSTAITLNVVASSVSQGSVTIPAAALTPVNATDFDLSFTVTSKGVIEVYAGTGLIGQDLSQDTPTPLGPVATLTPTAFPTAVLNPTVAVQSGTASSKTMNMDFVFTAAER